MGVRKGGYSDTNDSVQLECYSLEPFESQLQSTDRVKIQLAVAVNRMILVDSIPSRIYRCVRTWLDKTSVYVQIYILCRWLARYV